MRCLVKLVLPLTLLAQVVEAQPVPNPILAPHARDLVVLKGRELIPFNSPQFLQAPFTVLYFGAGWCPDCRRFSPSLVAAYDRQASGARQFEVLLVSKDNTAEGMQKFMQSEKMNWPALAFEKLAEAKDLTGLYSGHGIPCLTVVDHRGTIVLQSKNDQDAREVLQELEKLVNGKRGSP